MVVQFQPYQETLPDFPVFLPDFSVHAVQDVMLKVAAAFDADIWNADGRPARLEAIKERLAICEQEIARLQDLCGAKLNAAMEQH